LGCWQQKYQCAQHVLDSHSYSYTVRE
jgi:hypothetical protein